MYFIFLSDGGAPKRRGPGPIPHTPPSRRAYVCLSIGLSVRPTEHTNNLITLLDIYHAYLM